MGSHIIAGRGRTSDELRAALDAIRRIVQVLRESSVATVRASGLTAAQLFVLERLSREAPLSLGELALRTFTHQSSVSVVVSRLVERGLVSRRTASDDARRAEVTITAAGRRALARAPEPTQNQLVRALEELPASRRRLLAVTLGQLVAGMNLGEKPAGMFFEDTEGERAR